MSNSRTPDVITVAVSRVDGGLTILRVVTTEYRPTTEAEKADGKGNRVANWTIEPTPEYIDKIIAKHNWKGTPHECVSWRVVPNDVVDESTDRTFRNAWKDNGLSKPEVDMPKAREIHRERLRKLRAPILEDLDVDYIKADENGNAEHKQMIARRKQDLRDITQHASIDSATTPEELKQAALDILNG